MIHNPYPGLRPFLKEERLIFCGRDDHRDEMLEILHETHFLAVVGPSGCGKSSLVQAGLLPDLESGLMGATGARWCFIEMRPQDRPMLQLDKAIDELYKKQSRKHDKHVDYDPTRLDALSFAEILKQAALPMDTNFLLLVDQFEEIFRFRDLKHRSEILKLEAEAQDFVNLLIDLRKCSQIPVYVLITMRTDYLEDCASFLNLPEALNQSQFLTPRLNGVQLRDAIEEPARRFRAKVEPDLTQVLG